MEFYANLGKKITQTSQGVVQKTKDTAETIRLNGMISDEEKRIANFYSKIGSIYFQLHADSYEPTFEQMILGIKEAQVKIENYSEQVKRLKGIVRCPNCGGEVPYGAPFCSSCGSKMNVQSAAAPAANSNVQRCVKCGVPLTPGTAFCTNCGTKVEAAPASAPVVNPVVNSQPNPALNNANTTTNKIHWILSFLGQIVCAILFFLPTINLEVLWVAKDISFMKPVSEAGYSAIYAILLILFFSAAIVMLLPILQSKPLRSNSLVFMQIMSVLFFVVNVTVYGVIGNEVMDGSFGVAEYGLNAWGWIYIIMSVIMIVDLMVLSSKTKTI